MPGVLATAQTLIDAGKPDLADDYLTYYSTTELCAALDLAETLAAGLEARTRALHGITTSMTPRGPKQVW